MPGDITRFSDPRQPVQVGDGGQVSRLQVRCATAEGGAAAREMHVLHAGGCARAGEHGARAESLKGDMLGKHGEA